MKKFILFLFMFSLIPLSVLAAPLYSSREDIPIADGITLTKVREFYADHNISYSVIRADLSRPDVGLCLLTPDSGIDSLATVSSLGATEGDTVAAMNADFFSAVGSRALSLGIEVKDGGLLQSPINPDTMATAALFGDTLSFSYLDFHVFAVAPDWEYQEIRHINKHTSYYGDILMFTHDFNGGLSPAPGGEVVEVVVENGIVTQMRRNMPPVEIPVDGCVLDVSEGGSMFFSNHFAVGDPIHFDYYITPDVSSADVAFGGGAMLVAGGVPLKDFSHVISGYQPRSAIGVDKSGHTVYLVAVNGRQEQSRGMTMAELASFMAELGCDSAVNLDGGGSTNMVASTPWVSALHTVNAPSENRRVVNAVGLTYGVPSGPPASVLIESDEDAVFLGHTTRLSYALADKNDRPAEGTVAWSAVGGSVDNGVFTGTVGGPAVVTASAGDASASLPIFVVDTVSGILLPDSLVLTERFPLTFSVYDSSGHVVPVTDPSAFTVTSSDPSVVRVEDGVLVPGKSGRALISVSKDNAVSYMTVTVGADEALYEDSFEYDSGGFASYPAYVSGDCYLTEEYARTGKSSLCLYYDFSSETDDSQVVYSVFSEPVTVSENEHTLSLYAYTPTAFPYSIKAQLSDADGNALRVSFSPLTEIASFQKLSAALPADARFPLSLTRLYVVALKDDVRSEGTVYFDDLSFLKTEPFSPVFHPADHFCDDAERDGASGFRVGALSGEDTLISRFANGKMTGRLQDAAAFAALSSSSDCREIGQALVLSLRTSSGGIRKTDAAQWDVLYNAAEKTSLPYIFLLCDGPVFGADAFENEALQAFLSGLPQTVCVVSRGDHNSLTVRDGVRYFTLGDISGPDSLLSRAENYSLLDFHLASGFSYTWVPVLSR